MFCPKCHRAMDPELNKCMYCGYLNREYDYNKDRSFDVDYPNMGLNILGMFIPVIGFIMFITNKNNKPKMAGSILKYSIFGTVVCTIIYILINIFLVQK